MATDQRKAACVEAGRGDDMINEEQIPGILIIMRSETERQAILTGFEDQMPCVIVEAQNAEEALLELSVAPYDLIIMDVQISRTDGPQLVKTILGEMRPDIPIILVTSLGGEEVRDKCMELGAFSYITRPINVKRLADIARVGIRYFSTDSSG
jgi:two-component system chemotaxis response regulator CheY